MHSARNKLTGAAAFSFNPDECKAAREAFFSASGSFTDAPHKHRELDIAHSMSPICPVVKKVGKPCLKKLSYKKESK